MHPFLLHADDGAVVDSNDCKKRKKINKKNNTVPRIALVMTRSPTNIVLHPILPNAVTVGVSITKFDDRYYDDNGGGDHNDSRCYCYLDAIARQRTTRTIQW